MQTERESNPSRPPTGPSARERGALRLLRAVLAALLLLLVEVAWLSDRDLVRDPVRLLALMALLVVVVAAAETAAAVAWRVARLLAPRRPERVVTLLAAPFVVWAGRSLFSGNAIREVPYVLALELTFDVLALFGVHACVTLHERLARPAWRARAGAVAAVCAVGAFAAGWTDTHVQVGHYPAFHWLVAGGTVLAAATCVRALLSLRPARIPGQVATAALLFLVASLWGTWAAWSSPAHMALAAYSDGLVPKVRGAVVAARASDGGPSTLLVAAARGDGSHAARATPGATSGHSSGAAVEDVAPPPPVVLTDWLWEEGAGELQPGDAPGDRPGHRVRFGPGTSRLVRAARRDDLASLWRASVCVRGAGDTPGRLVLALSDGRGNRVTSAPWAPSDDWTTLSIDWTNVLPPPPPQEHRLPAGMMRAETGHAFTVRLPDDWLREGSSSASPGASRARLFEDDRELGPRNALHREIREGGGGAFSHWGSVLYFSTSDGTDPSTNGRTYRLTPPDEAQAPPPSGDLLLELIATDGTEQAPVQAWIADVRLERRDTGARAATATAAPAMLRGADADEFAFVPTPGEEARAVREATRNVIVILMDAFRDDHFGRVVDGASLTPHLDALAEQGVRFDTTYSPSDHTGRSIPCLMTSFPLDVTLGAADHELPLTTWLAQLRAAGFRTFHNGSNYVFRKYAHILLPPNYGAEFAGTQESKVDGLEDEVLAFVRDADDERPFAVFAHWSDAHVGRSKHMAVTYQDGVRKVDARVGRLVEGLRASGLLDETLVVVTSDHGYALGEDDRFLTGQGCVDYALRVPFVARIPGLDGPRRVEHPASGHDLFGTVLDIMHPAARASVWSTGVLPFVLDPSAVVPGRPVVSSSTGGSRLVRVGHNKLVVDASKDTRLLYDMRNDPEERSPTFDGPDRSVLDAVMAESIARESRLLRALVTTHRDQLPDSVVAPFLSESVDVSLVRPVLDGFWSLGDEARLFVLRSIVQRDLDDLRFELERLDRGLWTDDDQRLLVLRTWAGSRPAAETLLARFDDLGDEARDWLYDVLPDVPGPCWQILEERMLRTVRDLVAARPAVGDLSETRLALLSVGVARQLARATPPDVLAALVERFNAWSVRNPGPSLQTLRVRKFTRRDFLVALRRSMDDDDLHLLEGLVLNRDVAVDVPEICLEIDSEDSRRFLIGLIARWSETRDDASASISYMLPTLRRFRDEAFLDEANRLIQQNHPDVWALK